MPKSTTQAKHPLRWRFDISTFRLLGRELITDRITALFELVKNCYDANAENVYIEFKNVGTNSSSSSIIISDDGLGMTFKDVRDKWMVIGTNSKREKKYSPPPYNRKFVGEKGIGRFAVDKLGAILLLRTKKAEESTVTLLETDWRQYEALSKHYDDTVYESYTNDKDVSNVETKKKHKNPRKKYFTDIDNKYWFEEQNDDCKGTTLYIRSINEIWTLYDIQRAEKELSKLISPVKKLVLPFNVFISSNEHSNDYNKKEVKNNAIQFATEEIFLKFNLSEGTQDVLVNKKGTLDIEKRPILSAGPILFKFYFFDQAAKAKYKSHYKGESIDGVKIYRDGIITTPFAEYEHQDIKKRDILGIDKRRYSGFFDKISSSDLIGIVEITKEHNPRIIDATNRQDFVDNQEYRSLKEFIIEQILALEEYRKSQREEAKQKANIDLNKAKEDLKSFNSDLKSISNTRPELKQYLLPLERKVQKVIVDFNKGLKAYSELEKEKIRQENIFLSLMSLQDYALEISHVVRTSLARVIHLAEFFKTEFPNEQYNHVFEKYAVTIYNEMITLGRAVDFMLSYAGSNTDFTEINLKELIENLFLNVYHPIFEKNKIKVIVEINRPLIITHNRKFFEDIIENFISNSIKALSQAKEKIIKCTGVVELDQFTLYFSDNGSGIAEEDRRRIFDIYFTRTPELGGAGIGLFIVKKRIEALKGTVEVVDNELKPNGATFKIVLPFKR